jgi:hypothetical protein
MISGVAFTFVLLPCIAAVAAAAILRDWRLAAAVLFGGLALAFIAPVLGGYGLLVLPVAVGVALGALVTAISLWRDPDVDMWARMLRALIVSFAASFLNLITFANGA